MSFGGRYAPPTTPQFRQFQAQRVLLEVPVTLEDGRVRRLRVVQGDQHDLPGLVANFLEAVLAPDTAAEQLLRALEDRLPKVRLKP